MSQALGTSVRASLLPSLTSSISKAGAAALDEASAGAGTSHNDFVTTFHKHRSQGESRCGSADGNAKEVQGEVSHFLLLSIEKRVEPDEASSVWPGLAPIAGSPALALDDVSEEKGSDWDSGYGRLFSSGALISGGLVM